MPSLSEQRQAVEAAERYLRDRKAPRASEVATILAGLEAAAMTLRMREIAETRL